MKRNQKGFTLIELLAVIVILAVIALIATPLIMNVINDAKKGANRDAAYGVVKAVETSAMQEMAKNPTFTLPASCTLNADKTVCEGEGKSLKVNYKGTKPTEAKICFDDNGTATSTTEPNCKTTIKFGSHTFEMKADGTFPA